MKENVVLREAANGTPPSGSLVLQVAKKVEGMIVGDELLAGSKLNENSLSQRLEVSRSTLREAIRQLEKTGLVKIIPNRGVFVREVSLREALNLFDIRAGLARVAGRLAAARASCDQVGQLSQLHKEMVNSWKTGSLEPYYLLNQKFHELIMELTGNGRLAELDVIMSNELHLFRRKNLGNLAQLEISIHEHERILEGISSHDEGKAGLAFERHINAAKQRMLDSLTI
ncbi:hypothetical protein BTW10_02610 [Chromohalobacter japonicus]|uniref:HTH gntR-type domain-containing protein n=1 Tax=Chromohalobacter japonicus TaxID=223900 RepID=A0A1Q8TFC4_9GAMM|nr:GntR family transcriptional regulator [Chromohalobacter japonicus]OLO12383.1 hypothetical protein BTW10_02610 [Chromohalobacter japonicus]